MSLSGLKDVDREILKYLDDDQLLKICVVDRKTWRDVCDDNFLRRRLVGKYPGIEKYKKENETWKQFFLSAILYISKMKEMKQFEYTEGDFKKQYNLLKKYNDNMLLLYASKEGELSLVKHALKQGADFHVLENYPLRVAAANGRLNVVKYLVDLGADIHAEEDEALRSASQKGHLEVVKFLVEHGADVHAEEDGENALTLARENGHTKVVDYLKKFM